MISIREQKLQEQILIKRFLGYSTDEINEIGKAEIDSELLRRMFHLRSSEFIDLAQELLGIRDAEIPHELMLQILKLRGRPFVALALELLENEIEELIKECEALDDKAQNEARAGIRTADLQLYAGDINQKIGQTIGGAKSRSGANEYDPLAVRIAKERKERDAKIRDLHNKGKSVADISELSFAKDPKTHERLSKSQIRRIIKNEEKPEVILDLEQLYTDEAYREKILRKIREKEMSVAMDSLVGDGLINS